MKIFLTGGSGLLGREVLKLDKQLVAPSRQEMDITNLVAVNKAFKKHRPNVVLHLAAATNPPEHDKDPSLGIKVNIIGTANLALICSDLNIRLVYTSTDYLYKGPGPHKEEEPVFPPNNFYWSKLGGEAAVRLCPNHLILRLSFGPAPFPYEKVYADQYTSKLYADEMAPLVLAAAKSPSVGIMNLGGPRTTLESYAKRTRPDIQTIPRPDSVPEDTSLDISRMKRQLKIKDEKLLFKHRNIHNS